MKKSFFLLLFVQIYICLGAQTIVNPTIKSKTSFAIIIDNTSLTEAKDAVYAYRNVIEKDGLATYVISDDWQSPDAIRQLLIKLHADKKAPLEGVVFVGDIPIPMLRDAQHLTSAFKMDQRRAWNRSSVPSDRYYDDFGLKFDFLQQDSVQPLYYYFSLRPDSEHKISSNIYSARIKPLEKGKVDKYAQLRQYLQKVVDERTNNAGNVIDNLSMARGHGYNSESRVAWSGEQLALREQFPQAFKANNNTKFMDFDLFWPMKPYWLNEVQRPDLDVMLFHHHGSNDIQYVSGYKSGSDVNTSKENIKLYLRGKIKGAVDKGKDKEETIKYYSEGLGLPREWCEEAFDPKLILEDSLMNLTLDVYVSDILDIEPNARFVMFDACYNGSFYEDENIAGAYIFNNGKTIVTQGNTVNTIQDKWPDEFIGLLSTGLRVGHWGKYVHYLETHIIGDPTFRFANNSGTNIDINHALTVQLKDVGFWKKQLNSPNVDIQAIALRVLFDNNYSGISTLLKDTYFSSNSMIVRLEALKLLSQLGNDDFMEVLIAASSDSYELTRRLATEYMGKNGSDVLIPSLVSSVINDNASKRVNFKVSTAIKMMDSEKVDTELQKQVAVTPFYGKDYVNKVSNEVQSNKKSDNELLQTAKNGAEKMTARRMDITKYRNHPSYKGIDPLLDFVADSSYETDLRVLAVEALGWFKYSYRKADIINRLNTIAETENDARVKAEAEKSVNRLR